MSIQCPTCWAPPNAPCIKRDGTFNNRLHDERILLEHTLPDSACPLCEAQPGEPCKTPYGRPIKPHTARLIEADPRDAYTAIQCTICGAAPGAYCVGGSTHSPRMATIRYLDTACPTCGALKGKACTGTETHRERIDHWIPR